PGQAGYVAGRIDPNGVYDPSKDRGDDPTQLGANTDSGRGYYWLNAANAPRWGELIDRNGPNGDFDISRGVNQPERFGTNWAIGVVNAAGKAILHDFMRTIVITGVSDRYGDTQNPANQNSGDIAHSSHDAGVDIDVSIEATDRQSLLLA